MNFVIPMAGHGQRFKEAGYDIPKMLIEAHGKTLLEWSIDSLPLDLCTNLICIILQDHERQFNIREKIEQVYGKRLPIRYHFLEQVTRGQAETVYLAKELIDFSTDLLVFNIDTFFSSATLASKLRSGADGVLGSFHSRAPRFSYALLDEDEQYIVKTTEKEPISEHALTGLYHFKSPEDFFEAAAYHFSNDIRVNNEFYIAPMYNYLISKGKRYILDEVTQHHILGTPEELTLFLMVPKQELLK